MVPVIGNVLAEVDVPQVGEVIVEVGGGNTLALANIVTPPVKDDTFVFLNVLTYIGRYLG